MLAVFWLSAVSSIAAPFSSPSERDGSPAPPTQHIKVAAYVWGGLLQQGSGIERFHRSVGFLLDHGFHSVRFTVGPNAASGYGFDPRSCPLQRGTMKCMLEAQLGDPVFDDPRLRSIYLTMEEFEDGGADSVANTLLYKNRVAIAREYADALDFLAARFEKRHDFTLTILNWEGDNKIYCGSAFQFAHSAEARASCEGSGDVRVRMSAYMDWTRLRLEAVEQARQRHPGVTIAFAVEINNVGMFSTRCDPVAACSTFPTLLNALAALGPQPLCSYSAYESLNGGDLAAALERILSRCGRVILGEIGFRRQSAGQPTLAAKYDSLQRQLLPFADRIEAIVYWNAFDPPSGPQRGYGLFDADGSPRNVDILPDGLRPH